MTSNPKINARGIDGINELINFFIIILSLQPKNTILAVCIDKFNAMLLKIIITNNEYNNEGKRETKKYTIPLYPYSIKQYSTMLPLTIPARLHNIIINNDPKPETENKRISRYIDKNINVLDNIRLIYSVFIDNRFFITE